MPAGKIFAPKRYHINLKFVSLSNPRSGYITKVPVGFERGAAKEGIGLEHSGDHRDWSSMKKLITLLNALLHSWFTHHMIPKTNDKILKQCTLHWNIAFNT